MCHAADMQALATLVLFAATFLVIRSKGAHLLSSSSRSATTLMSDTLKRSRANDDHDDDRLTSAPRKDEALPPKALTILCMDASGSMRLDGKYVQMTDALKKEVEEADANTFFLIVMFNDTITFLGNNQPMDKSAARAAIERLPSPENQTAIYKAISKIGEMMPDLLKTYSKELLVVKILTDGDDNLSNEEDATNAKKVVRDILDEGGVVTLLQAGSSRRCARALDLKEDMVLFFSDQGSSLANAAFASRQATEDYRHAVLSRAPTAVAPSFSYTSTHRTMSIESNHPRGEGDGPPTLRRQLTRF